MVRGKFREFDPPGVSVISWVNDLKMWNNVLLRFMHPIMLYQQGDVPVEFITIQPDDGCKTMGQAYELGRQRAKYQIKAYLHQDMTVVDPSFYPKCQAILGVVGVGAFGFVGSKVDTGGSWMHCDFEDVRGLMPTGNILFGVPTAEQVAVVDGYGFVTCLDLPWDGGYEGPHMAVEDYCMQVRAAGEQVWVADSTSSHESPGTVDESYWRSVARFQVKWFPYLGPHKPVWGLKADFYERAQRVQDNLPDHMK